MMDLGYLREGIIDESEFIIKPIYENLSKLCKAAEDIEEEIDRNLDIISGGATTTLSLVFEGNIPKKINNLRIGEAIIVGRDIIEFVMFYPNALYLFSSNYANIEYK